MKTTLSAYIALSAGEVLCALVIWLGKNCHSEAVSLKHSRYNGNAKGRVINVSVTRHIYEIYLGPIPSLNILPIYRKKIHSITHIRS